MATKKREEEDLIATAERCLSIALGRMRQGNVALRGKKLARMKLIERAVQSIEAWRLT
jgi:hypothetical protein